MSSPTGFYSWLSSQTEPGREGFAQEGEPDRTASDSKSKNIQWADGREIELCGQTSKHYCLSDKYQAVAQEVQRVAH